MKSFTLLSLITLAGLTACAFAPTNTKTSEAESMYAIQDAAIVDVEKGTIVPHQTVIIRDDRIEEIYPAGSTRVPEAARVIDASGLYLIPGLMDAHVHYLEPEIFGRLMIANGVLLARDMGMPNDYILKLRDELKRGETLGPEMIATGAILDREPPLIPVISLGFATPEEGREAVRSQAATGVDMIKVYSGLKREVFLAMLDEAHKLGIKVVGHVPDEIYIEDAAAAGLAESEHLFGFEKVIARLLGEKVNLEFIGFGADAGYFARFDEVDPDELKAVYERLRRSGLSVCPTIVVFKTGTHYAAIKAGDHPFQKYVSQNLLSIWQSQWSSQEDAPDFIWRNWARMVKQLNETGIPLLVGTDLMVPGIIPGYSAHEEMAIWQEAGLPAADILRSATIVPAELFGLDDRLGSIEEGKTASLVLLRANPLEDIRNTEQIEAVFLRGHYFSRRDLDKLLLEAEQFARQPAQ